ncbi:hypothetical protein LEP1GSC036_0748 [Leptospira weilii str. 2006001853]|uniref:Uncharacterized protein n=1 Tax=Leptospira weilii str. 2006001853 TaxID=1001589 RepID=A0A828Z957_9LEPT|nr:hypothetical protein LEP1GSC036_0748 [Leptospira weilii str. 2006001853]EMN46622.1 hypothetical protein LEP1GSC086_4094 [Leptospira weilii str. LNT 1234]
MLLEKSLLVIDSGRRAFFGFYINIKYFKSFIGYYSMRIRFCFFEYSLRERSFGPRSFEFFSFLWDQKKSSF